MTYYTYMIRTYISAPGPKGDLARDMKEDKERFPRNSPVKLKGWHKLIDEYLLENGAEAGCLDAFEQSWDEYVMSLKNKKERMSHDEE